MARRMAGAVVGIGCMALGAWLLRRRGAVQFSLTARAELGDTPGDFPVLDYGSLIERMDSERLIALLRAKLGMPGEVFDSAVRPVIEGYAEFVQLLPAVPSGQAVPGLLFVHTLAVVLRALDYRRGQILPRGAPPEVIGAQMHRWTYAVFIGALLCDIDGVMNELAVTMRCCDGRDACWTPHSGSMQASGALRYRVGRLEKTVATADVSSSLSLLLLDRIAPPAVLAWLAAEPALMSELRRFLAGDMTDGSGVIAALVLRARTDFAGISTPSVPETASRPASDELTPVVHSQAENISQGDRSESCTQPPEPRPAGSRPPEPRKPLDSRDSLAEIDSAPMTTAVLPEAPGANTSLLAGPEFFDDFEKQRRSSRSLRIRGASALAAVAPGSTGELSPRLPVTLRPRGPSPDADRFMDWLQAGLADGSLPFNDQGSLVHLVPEGMLLVSPRIFREYATRCGAVAGAGMAAFGERNAEIGKAIQLQVLRAGWHVRGRKGVNILSYQVMRGDDPVSRLSGVVIRNPERFVTPVPAVNPLLIRVPPEHPQA